MKKVTLSLIAILVVVGISLSIISRGGEYAAERLFYRAIKASKKIAINPDVAPPRLVSSVEKDLKSVLEKYPDTNAAKAAHLALAEFYLSRKKYDEALSTLNDIIGTEDQSITILSRAHFFKGSLYEKQDQWDKALKEYMILRDTYTDTQLGLQVPIHIGRYYTVKGREAEADEAYREAVVFYEKLERDNRGKILGYAASTLLRETYISLRQYEQAGRVLEDTINNYPAQLTFVQQLPYVELIFVKALKRPEKAIEIYKNVKKKTKNEE